MSELPNPELALSSYAALMYGVLDEVKRKRGPLPSITELAQEMACSGATVGRAKAELVRLGVLLIEKESGEVKRWALQRQLPFEGGCDA